MIKLTYPFLAAGRREERSPADSKGMKNSGDIFIELDSSSLADATTLSDVVDSSPSETSSRLSACDVEFETIVFSFRVGEGHLLYSKWFLRCFS